MKIKTLNDFYNEMFKSRDLRRKMVVEYMNGKEVFKEEIIQLNNIRENLEGIDKKSGKYTLQLTENQSMPIDLTYEIEELKRDVIFLEENEESFLKYLDDVHMNFYKQVDEGVKYLKGKDIRNFVTDRDGTINNYCARYQSSIQSIYNAVFISRFAQKMAENNVILTSAPLINVGLADISVNMPNAFIYAGSKGREYIDEEGNRKSFPIEADKQLKLDELNKKLGQLVRKPEYNKFSLIGSGLQYKFGQTTIARQDVNNSIPAKESEAFMDYIVNLVQETDPENKYFRIEDTGKDIEVILTIQSADNELKDFDKGDGVNYLDESISMNMKQGYNLICGDTNSDVPMIPASVNKTKDTLSIFVTRDDNLEKKVKGELPDALIVTEPDVLVAILNNVSK